MADDTDDAVETPDFSEFVPESFKGENGAWDTAGFRAKYDELASFHSQEQERLSSLPETPEDYGLGLAEDHQWPEGFDPAKLSYKDEQGNTVEFDPAKIIDEKDPDVSAMRAALHELKAPPALAQKLAGIFVNREIRGMVEGAKTAEAEKQKLGPQADSRIATVTRELQTRLPAEQAKALLDDATSADAVRAIEALLAAKKSPVASAGGGEDLSTLSPRELIARGLEQRASTRK